MPINTVVMKCVYVEFLIHGSTQFSSLALVAFRLHVSHIYVSSDPSKSSKPHDNFVYPATTVVLLLLQISTFNLIIPRFGAAPPTST